MNILYLGKQLARYGSLSSDANYQHIYQTLSQMLVICSIPVYEVNEPILAQPRKKGRPKNCSHPKCLLCNKPHPTTKCGLYEYYKYLTLCKDRKRKRKGEKCSICKSYDHNAATCDIKITAEMGLTSKQVFEFYKSIHLPNLGELIKFLKSLE